MAAASPDEVIAPLIRAEISLRPSDERTASGTHPASTSGSAVEEPEGEPSSGRVAVRLVSLLALVGAVASSAPTVVDASPLLEHRLAGVVVAAVDPENAGDAPGDSSPVDTAITIETTVRNTNLGLLVRTSVFGSTAAASDPVADLALFTLLAYAGISIALTVPLILSGRRTGAAAPRALLRALEDVGVR